MNKKGYSLFELSIVITLIAVLTLAGLSLFNVYKRISFENLSDGIKLQIQSARNVTWGGVTLKTKLLAKDQTTGNLGLNKGISRFVSDPAYYTVLLFTTKPNFGVSLGGGDIGPTANENYYLLQYRQEKYTDYTNNIKESLTLTPNTSNQILKFNNTNYYSKFNFGSMGKIFLNKIMDVSGNCLTSPSLNTELYILFDYDNLVPKFMTNQGQELKDSSGNELSKVKLCFSTQSFSYKKEINVLGLYQELILDKNTLYNTNNYKIQ